jgi:hypothetical protein
VYYDRVASGDVVRYRQSSDGGTTWSPVESVSPADGRNWGPDLVARQDGSVVVCWDHAEEDGRSRGWYRVRDARGSWSEPTALTEDGAVEIGSGHIADAGDGDLAYVWIGKPLGPQHHFRAWWRWYRGGTWGAPHAISDGTVDAWHTNVERRRDGSVRAAFDLSLGDGELFTMEGKDGKFSSPTDFSADGRQGERANFGFGPQDDVVAWFRKERAFPLHVYTRKGAPGRWEATSEPNQGLGGYHFDPDVAVSNVGIAALVWGWDGGQDAEILYSFDRGTGWEPPRKLGDVDWGKPGLPSIDARPDGTFAVVWTQGVRGSNQVYFSVLTP